jgi:cell division protein FtsW
MTQFFNRSDSTLASQWFWTVDRVLLLLLFLLIAIGLVLVLGASAPQVQRLERAQQVELNDLHFFNRQLLFAFVALLVMIGVSFLSRVWVRRGAALAFPVLFICIALTLVLGSDTKGATRWLPVLGIPFQPSEFMKPCLAVLTAWLLSARFHDPQAPALQVSLLPVLAVVALLVMQPDFGQSALILLVWLTQAILAGLPLVWVGVAGVAMISGLAVAFLTVPHVHDRLIGFFGDQAAGYQVRKALEAFQSGGLFGVGPAEGVVKWQIPDAHADYIFALAGEEYGLFACLMLVLLYLAIIWRAARQQVEEEDPFVFLASAGLITSFGAQAFINMGVNVALLPSKGMTLPFISYGGSSMIATALTLGMLLALGRRYRFVRNQGRRAA